MHLAASTARTLPLVGPTELREREQREFHRDVVVE